MSGSDNPYFDKLRPCLAQPQSPEELYRRLVRFFEWEGCCEAESCASEVLQRIVARLDAGERVPNMLAAATTVARQVLKERMNARLLEQARLTVEPTPQAPGPQGFQPDREGLRAFQRCFSQLSEGARQLLRDFYRERPNERIAAWKALAERKGIALGELRTLAMREREGLDEECRRHGR